MPSLKEDVAHKLKEDVVHKFKEVVSEIPTHASDSPFVLAPLYPFLGGHSHMTFTTDDHTSSLEGVTFSND